MEEYNKILNLREVKLGYCQCCGLPNIVGSFELSHWKHLFSLCSRCLREFGEKVDDVGKALVKI